MISLVSILATTLGFVYSTEELARGYFRPLQVAHYSLLLQNYYREGGTDNRLETVFRSTDIAPPVVTKAMIITDDAGRVLYGTRSDGEKIDLQAYAEKYPIVITLTKQLWMVYPQTAVHQFGQLLLQGRYTWILVLILIVLLISAYFGIRVAFQFESLMRRARDRGDRIDERRDDNFSREVIAYISSIRQEPMSTTEHIEKLKQFNATIAHELRNQLNTISVAVELLQYRRDGTSDKTFTILMNEIKHINRLVNDLHLLSLVEIQKLAITPHPMPMHAVLGDIVDAARARSEPTVLHYDVTDDAQSISAYIDEERFRQAVDNLIDNAVRHSNTDDVVLVTLRCSDDECVISVQDHGTGIPAGEIEYLFHRFYRASNARGKGSGLGLAIAQEIIHGHCGSIHIRSTLDVGTAIEIRLPLATNPT
jgi:signal transduction histidine kinase